MHIRFLIDPARCCLWHGEAIRRVLDAGDDRHGSWRAVTKRQRLSPVLALERLVYGAPADSPLARLDVAALEVEAADGPADFEIDLAGGDVATGLSLGCCGADLATGAIRAILAGAPPLVTLSAHGDGGVRTAGAWLVGVEDPGVLGRGLANVLGRAVDMLAVAVDRLAAGATLADLALPSVAAPATPAAGRRPLAHFAATLLGRIGGRFGVGRHAPAGWTVAWRHATGDDTALPRLDAAPFATLVDDGQRFYADPFLWGQAGKAFLFVEDYPYLTGKGVISAVPLGADGPEGRPEPVLETDCHLSYPHIFAADGHVYMLPETSGRRTVELWRAERFPDRWVPAAVLIDDVDIGDATLFHRDGRWFLFGAERPRWGSSWDGLTLWTAAAVTGPWRRVGIGPVKVDVASARPAGCILRLGDRLIRPFQDSVGGYGAGLGFAEIDRCDGGGFAERILARRRGSGAIDGLHTYNRGFGFEVIDVLTADRPVEVRL